MAITINNAIKAFINIREETAKRERSLKEWRASIKDAEAKLEKFIRSHMKKLDLTSVGANGNTAFETEKDFVRIEDKEKFKLFLAKQMLLDLQSYMYKKLEGDWQPDGESDLADHAKTIVESGTFDLLTLSANKTNCKDYMEKHDGLMPEGIKYDKETVIQIRKGKG